MLTEWKTYRHGMKPGLLPSTDIVLTTGLVWMIPGWHNSKFTIKFISLCTSTNLKGWEKHLKKNGFLIFYF